MTKNALFVNFSKFNISEDSESEGFDLEAGQTWIYPTNYAVRDYQYNIVQQALLKNTLVSSKATSLTDLYLLVFPR